MVKNLKNNIIKIANEKKPIISVDHTAGQVLDIAGGKYRIVVSGKQTNGEYAVIEMTVPPGAGPVPHAHPDLEELFYVLEGEMRFISEHGDYVAKKDSQVSIPKGGVIHQFKNETNQPARLLCTVLPAGLDDFFIKLADYINQNKLSEAELKKGITELSEKHGQLLYPPNYLQ